MKCETGEKNWRGQRAMKERKRMKRYNKGAGMTR